MRTAFTVLVLLATPITVTAAAPHIVILYSGDDQIVISDWGENHRLMASLSDEPVNEDLTITGDRTEYLNVALFWFPKWRDYPTPEDLNPIQGDQFGRLHLGDPPILVLEGQPARYVGVDGVRMLEQHGVVTRKSRGRLLYVVLAIGVVAVMWLWRGLRKERKP
jgi:hypothetical protein